ncbi:MAG: LCP family protein [Clostridia bacterium]|nr:LCP family protein [Clostridia bacterium]
MSKEEIRRTETINKRGKVERTEKVEKKGKNRKQKKKHRVLKAFIIIILLIAIAIGVFVAYSTWKNGWGITGMIQTALGHDKDTVKNLEEFKVLVLGVSTDTSAVLTDTIIVASYDPKTQSASMLSIPRDTFVGKSESTATSYNKINALYQTNIDKILSTVNDITGLDIEYYVIVDTEALIKLVDTIGGVEFNVPINMDYDDSSQNLHIHLKAGLQKLDGEKSENLVRFRHNNNGTSYPASYGDNDIGRMRTQREFITQVIKQTIQLKNITKIGEIMDIAYKYVETNVQISDAKDYIPYALEFNVENIKTGTLPGTPAKINGLWFYKYDKKESAELVKELFEVKGEDNGQGQSEGNNTTNEISEAKMKENAKIKIEIINSSGASSTLKAVETLLKKQGYAITKTSTTTENRNTAIINNTKVEQEVVDDIKGLLKTGIIQNSNNTSSTSDITIIIGTNYNK